MKFDTIIEKITCKTVITATNEDEFKRQFKEALEELKNILGVVYIIRTKKEIQRFKGSSSVLYIGQTLQSIHQRYNSASAIEIEIRQYWARYAYAISTFGGICIDIYKNDSPVRLENSFLYQYHKQHLELPPLNLASYKESILELNQTNIL